LIPLGLLHGAATYLIGKIPGRDLDPAPYRLDRITEARVSNQPGAASEDCLAARQTQVDYAQTLFDLWHRIWPDLGAGWDPAPYEPGDKELTLDPQVRWEQQYFQRSFDLKPKRLRANLWLFLTPSSPSGSEIELGCTLVQGTKWLLKKGSMQDGWSWDKDNEGFQFAADVAVSDNGLDLAPFAEAAHRAVSFIKDFVRK
jgi:hypothetical protein